MQHHTGARIALLSCFLILTAKIPAQRTRLHFAKMEVAERVSHKSEVVLDSDTMPR